MVHFPSDRNDHDDDINRSILTWRHRDEEASPLLVVPVLLAATVFFIPARLHRRDPTGKEDNDLAGGDRR